MESNEKSAASKAEIPKLNNKYTTHEYEFEYTICRRIGYRL